MIRVKIPFIIGVNGNGFNSEKKRKFAFSLE